MEPGRDGPGDPSEDGGGQGADVTNEVTMAVVLEATNLRRAWAAVKRNQGSGGIDGKSITETAGHLKDHWPAVRAALEVGNYTPAAVRGVAIPKRSGGERLLGIPTVQDRLIQQALGQALVAVFEPTFSEHSYGFRPGRSAHDAVLAAQGFVRSGKGWVVDIDLRAFFDHVDHDILIERLKPHVADKRVLALIGRYLRAPMVLGGERCKRRTGTPQGGPLSPILANIYLDAMDRELERRGLSFCRYADDIVIFVGSERSAQRVLETTTRWIETHLKLPVNYAKSGTGRPWERQLLGFRILEDGRIALAERSLAGYRDQVRAHWNARQSLTSKELVERWQRYIRGWCNYFRLAEARWVVAPLEKWTRRHMRKCFWLRWHNADGRRRALRRLGAAPYHLATASASCGAWRMARSGTLNTILSTRVLRRYGLWTPSDLWAAT